MSEFIKSYKAQETVESHDLQRTEDIRDIEENEEKKEFLIINSNSLVRIKTKT